MGLSERENSKISRKVFGSQAPGNVAGSILLIRVVVGKYGGDKGIIWPEPESNRRHKDFQSSALPTELPGHTIGKNILYNGI